MTVIVQGKLLKMSKQMTFALSVLKLPKLTWSKIYFDSFVINTHEVIL